MNTLYHDLTDSQWEKVKQNYKKFRQWINDGVFDNLIENNAEESKIIAIDSTFCKVHQSVAGVRKIYGNQDIGTSRGGKFIFSLMRKCNLSNFYFLQEISMTISFFTLLSSKVKRYWQIKFKVTHTFDKELYFCELKNYKRIATRYEKLSISFFAFVSLAVYLISR